MKSFGRVKFITFFVSFFAAAHLHGAFLDFDLLTDLEPVTNQFSSDGIDFTNATVLSAGLSLNDAEFPPRSNFNVLVDDGGPIQISFATPLNSVAAFFTYTQPILLEAFNSSSVSLGTVQSAAGCNTNLALSGDLGCSPNEELGLSGIGAISRLTVTGDPQGFSFTLDDLTYEVRTGDESPVPEPSTTLLFTIGGAALLLVRRKR